MARWMRRMGQRLSGSALVDALAVAYQTRTTGLAAEASFWAVFALPWLFLGLVAGLTRVQVLIGVDAVEQFRTGVLDLADEVLTPQAIDDLILRELHQVLRLPGATVSERWTGTYASADDVVFQTSPAPGVALGIVTGGTGASTAFAFGEELVQRALGEAVTDTTP